MKKYLSLIGITLSLSPLAASASMTPIERYESKTFLSSKWENPENRKLLETRLKLNHSNMLTGEFFERPFEANKVEIGKYSQSWRCFSGEKSACRTQAAR